MTNYIVQFKCGSSFECPLIAQSGPLLTHTPKPQTTHNLYKFHTVLLNHFANFLITISD